MLALEMHVGLGDACWPCFCVWISLMRAGLVACWLIRFMAVLLYSIGLIVAYFPF